MTRVDVVSDMMFSVGYDPNVTVLEVEFRNGSIYQYLGVPPQYHAALIMAPSKGRFFNAEVRCAFRYRRVN